MKPWKRQFLAHFAIAAVSLIMALLAIGQAVTLAWLSQFPASEPRLASLQVGFWVYLAIGLIALVAGAGAVLRWVRLQNSGLFQNGGSPRGNGTAGEDR
ncbi:hypothetical protein [Mesorhizobium sp. 131-2-1]|uniref:hypothetical protein n=1 Tax=Mesorhizobium sp. 131-2-1 TaxID=2744518 RepID=UPI001926EE7E|nr:hypothetical protein [Mesorhizobium sp. 131-2-1]BCG95596.1 hypothetical protein MesoLj131a_44600 [Mesorhizobium sp. 131-2-1]